MSTEASTRSRDVAVAAMEAWTHKGGLSVEEGNDEGKGWGHGIKAVATKGDYSRPESLCVWCASGYLTP